MEPGTIFGKNSPRPPGSWAASRDIISDGMCMLWSLLSLVCSLGKDFGYEWPRFTFLLPWALNGCLSWDPFLPLRTQGRVSVHPGWEPHMTSQEVKWKLCLPELCVHLYKRVHLHGWSMCVHTELMYVRTHTHTNSPALTQESPFFTEIFSRKCLRHFNKLKKTRSLLIRQCAFSLHPRGLSYLLIAFLGVSLNPQCSEGSLYLPLLQHGLVGAGVPPVGQKMMVVTRCLKVLKAGGVELPGASRMAINFPEQQGYFPSYSCSHTALLKDGLLPSPLLLYDSRIHCCLKHGAWRSPRAMQEQAWGLTLYTGFPITTAWPSLPMWTKYMWLQYIICKYNILTRGCMA